MEDMGRTITDDEIRDAFAAFDRDGNETLSVRELGDALNLLCIDLTPQELTEKYSIDDDPETLNYEEFCHFVRDRDLPHDCASRCKESLQEFDNEHTGAFTRDQFKAILTIRGMNPIDEDEAEQILGEIPMNDDGNYEIDAITDFFYQKEQEEGYEQEGEI